MLPVVRDAQIDFARLAAEEPSSLYFEDFLRGGFEAWPQIYQHRYPRLAVWRGVQNLKQKLCRLARPGDAWNVTLASRSLTLLKMGARRMFRQCRRVLTTDLSWSSYQASVICHSRRGARKVFVVPLRVSILRRRWSASDVVDFLARRFAEYRCDGLFLPAVDHLGVRLPIGQIANAIRVVSPLRFLLVDAAQAFCHVPLTDVMANADFVVTGSHKWMGAYFPTGIAYSRKCRPVGEHDAASDRLTKCLHMDPLLSLTETLADHKMPRFGETVNLSGVIACAAASNEHTTHRSAADSYRFPLPSDASCVEPPDATWRHIRIGSDFATRILLFQKDDMCGTALSADDVRRAWLQAGMIATGYDGGLARVSLPVGYVNDVLG